jgi:hypothetical protein
VNERLLVNRWFKESGFPSFAKAEPSKLRFEQRLERRRVVAARLSMLHRVSFLTTTVMEAGIPLLHEGGEYACPNRFPIWDSTAFAGESVLQPNVSGNSH